MNSRIITTASTIAAALTLSACVPAIHGPVDPNHPGPVVVAPSPNPHPNPNPYPDPAAPLEQYVVQLTASNSQRKAMRIRDQFSAEGYNAFVSPLVLDGRLLHRVQIGMFTHRDDANMVLAQMQHKYPNDPYVAEAVTKTP